MREKVSMTVTRFRDKNGEKTCAETWAEADGICEFLMTGSMGTRESCFFPGHDEGKLYRRNTEKGNSMGTLIPHRDCPLWKE
jgi:hypothetical protein